MSILFSRHSKIIDDAVTAYRRLLSELDADISVIAMASSTDHSELALLRRLRGEYRDILYKYENLHEACQAVEAEPRPIRMQAS